MGKKQQKKQNDNVKKPFNQQTKQIKKVNAVSSASHSMTFHKQLGQHILINSDILHKTIEKANIKPSDIVVEIGPGTGNLTQLLLEKAKKVIVYEMDVRMVTELTKRFKSSTLGHKIEIIQGDFLQKELPYFDLCVANVPYNISSPIVFKLLSHRPTFRSAILMFQLEFSERLVAQPGSKQYCRLSANTQLLAKTTHLFKVGKNNFRPPPKVESSFVRIEPKNPPPQINYIEWDALLRICFVRKNKLLRAVFKNKKLLKILENNYNLFIKQKNDGQIDQNQQLDAKQITEQFQKDDYLETQLNDEQQDQDDMESNQGDQEKNIFKEKLMQILDQNNFGNLRSSKLSVEDFIRLLYVFNKQDIHFK